MSPLRWFRARSSAAQDVFLVIVVGTVSLLTFYLTIRKFPSTDVVPTSIMSFIYGLALMFIVRRALLKSFRAAYVAQQDEQKKTLAKNLAEAEKEFRVRCAETFTEVCEQQFPFALMVRPEPDGALTAVLVYGKKVDEINLQDAAVLVHEAARELAEQYRGKIANCN